MIPPISDDDLKRITDTLRKEGIIQAIRVFREITGVGLAEAKAAVEAIRDVNFRGAATTVATEVVSAMAPPVADALDRVSEALRRGNKIEAIKLYREITRSSLAAAKEAVEKMARNVLRSGTPESTSPRSVVSTQIPRAGLPKPTTPSASTSTPNAAAPPPLPQAVTEDAMNFVREALAQGHKIEAVKRYRDLTRCSLADAKQAVEALEEGMSRLKKMGSAPEPAATAHETDPPKSLHAALYRGNKEEAMRLYRMQHGVGPGEAKLAIDRMEARMRGRAQGQSTVKSTSCLARLIGLLVILLALGLGAFVIWQLMISSPR